MVTNRLHSNGATLRQRGLIKSHATQLGLHNPELITSSGNVLPLSKNFCEALDSSAHPRVGAPMEALPAVGVEVDVAERTVAVMSVVCGVAANPIPVVFDFFPSAREVIAVVSVRLVRDVVTLADVY